MTDQTRELLSSSPLHETDPERLVLNHIFLGCTDLSEMQNRVQRAFPVSSESTGNGASAISGYLNGEGVTVEEDYRGYLALPQLLVGMLLEQARIPVVIGGVRHWVSLRDAHNLFDDGLGHLASRCKDMCKQHQIPHPRELYFGLYQIISRRYDFMRLGVR